MIMKPQPLSAGVKSAVFTCLCVCAVLLLFSACSKKPSINTDMNNSMYRFFLYNYDVLDTMQKKKASYEYGEKFSDKERIAQLFMVNIDGSTTYSKANDFNDGISPGAYIFFTFNIDTSPSSVIAFTDSVYDYYKDSIPPLLAIDHEGGSVNRLRSITSPLPSQLSVSKYCSEQEASSLYENTAHQLRLLGFTFNLSPVAEPLLESNEEFLQDRSFGSIDKTILLSSVLIESYNKYNILCALKHFPGNTNDDPHTGLPRITVSRDVFQNQMVHPFHTILNNSPLHTAVLLSHAVIPSVTGTIPACFSKELTTGILKDSIGFKGLILTDDIFMGAIADQGYDAYKSVESALLAGADMIMSSQKRFVHLIPYIQKRMMEDTHLMAGVNESFTKIIQTKIKTGVLRYHKISSYDIFTMLPSINEYRVVNSNSEYSSIQREEKFNQIKNDGLELYAAYFNED